METAGPIVHTAQLSIGYPDKMIASDIRFDILPGTFTAILGHNGTGKSTLLKTIADLQTSISGEVCIDNKPIPDYSVFEKSRLISIVLSNRNEIVQTLRVYEVLSLAVAPHREWYRKLSAREQQSIEEMAAQLGIDRFMNRQLFSLSDGEMQKVAIARALLQNTPILLLDEPTAHLDLHHKIEIYLLLQSLARSGKTIICTSHDVELAVKSASHGLLIGEGRAQFNPMRTLIDSGAISQYFTAGNVQFNSAALRFDYSL